MNVPLQTNVDPRPYYDAFFDDDGTLITERALVAFDFLNIPVSLRHLVQHGELGDWPLPSWDMPYRPITEWEYEALVQGRTIGMRSDRILISAYLSIPILDAYLSAGRDAVNNGLDSVYTNLAREWGTAKYRSQQRAMMKLAKENPIQFLKRTDTDGEFDDKEYLRALRYKADLDKEVEEKPIQVQFDFDG